MCRVGPTTASTARWGRCVRGAVGCEGEKYVYGGNVRGGGGGGDGGEDVKGGGGRNDGKLEGDKGNIGGCYVW